MSARLSDNKTLDRMTRSAGTFRSQLERACRAPRHRSALRCNMSIATRYRLLVVGCILQATFVSVCMNRDGFTLIEHQPILSTPGGLLWHAALWLWPAWSFLLWKQEIELSLALALDPAKGPVRRFEGEGRMWGTPSMSQIALMPAIRPDCPWPHLLWLTSDPPFRRAHLASVTK